jgi:hypothetical protein
LEYDCASPEKTKQGGGQVTEADRGESNEIDPHEPDIEVVARVRADKLRFDAEPEVEVRFPGSGKRDSRQVTTRRNIDKPIKPGKTYRRVFVATRISSRLIDEDGER